MQDRITQARLRAHRLRHSAPLSSEELAAAEARQELARQAIAATARRRDRHPVQLNLFTHSAQLYATKSLVPAAGLQRLLAMTRTAVRNAKKWERVAARLEQGLYA